MLESQFLCFLVDTYLKKDFNVETVSYFREIKKEEFKKVMRFLLANNRKGIAQCDGLPIGPKVNNSVNNGGTLKYIVHNNPKIAPLSRNLQPKKSMTRSSKPYIKMKKRAPTI